MAEKQNEIKRIRIIAGPNGSGKTTLYYLLKDFLFTGVWINADEILATINKTGILDFQQLGFAPNISLFDRIYVLDNSTSSMRLIVSFVKGKIEKIYDDDIPYWIQNIITK